MIHTQGARFAIAVLIAGSLAAMAAIAQVTEDPQIDAYLKKPVPLAKADQDALSKAVFQVLAKAPDDAKPEFFERYYKIVMDRCPDTDRAHESYWRLTNLYNQAFDPPKHEEIVKILQQFLARYKTSTVVSMKKYPDRTLVFSPIRSLHQAYEALKRYAPIAAYYDGIASREKDFAIYDFFDYAGALEKVQRSRDAVVWYEKFLKKTEGNEDVDFMREIAQDRVKELRKK